ncbi:DNA-protecting protein DprA [Aerococcaceae bacterium DSM 111020]|nr:DNA-protecting protein DprA [Aerococcaceae bacterium DSM 111020]
MKLTTKEVLIWFKILDITYHDQLNLFKMMIQSDQFHSGWSLNDLQRLIQCHPLKNINQKRFNTSIDNDKYHGIQELAQRSLMIGEGDYPLNWLHLPQPPLLIFYHGDLSILKMPLISMIGTRNISAYGKEMTYELAKAFSDNKIGIVSGLALGVDQIAHETALQNDGRTIAIIPNGFHHSYPKKNASLQKKMMKDQLVLSEYLPTQNVRKHQFIMRNRLVAGLTPVTLVIEAAQKSGSLITANYAIQFNRELFVLPGQINHPQAKGCNQLIYHGATPIISIEQTMIDVAEILTKRSSF